MTSCCGIGSSFLTHRLLMVLALGILASMTCIIRLFRLLVLIMQCIITCYPFRLYVIHRWQRPVHFVLFLCKVLVGLPFWERMFRNHTPLSQIFPFQTCKRSWMLMPCLLPIPFPLPTPSHRCLLFNSHTLLSLHCIPRTILRATTWVQSIRTPTPLFRINLTLLLTLIRASLLLIFIQTRLLILNQIAPLPISTQTPHQTRARLAPSTPRTAAAPRSRPHSAPSKDASSRPLATTRAAACSNSSWTTPPCPPCAERSRR